MTNTEATPLTVGGEPATEADIEELLDWRRTLVDQKRRQENMIAEIDRVIKKRAGECDAE